GGLRLNEALLDELIAVAARKGAALPPSVAPARLDGLMALKGVLDGGDPAAAATEARDAALLAGLRRALAALVEARRQEGARLARVVAGHLDAIAALSADAARAAALQPAALKARLVQQLRDLVAEVPPLTPE